MLMAPIQVVSRSEPCRSESVASSSTTAAAPTAPPTTSTTAAEASTAAFTLGPCLIDVQCSAANVSSVYALDCTLTFCIVGHLDKCKTSGLAAIPIRDDVPTKIYLAKTIDELGI